MADEFESGAFAMEGAWHGLGTIVPHLMKTQEAAETAGITWTVEKRQAYTFADGPNGRQFVEIPDRFAIVRTSDQRPLGTVGREYQCIQNVEALDFLDFTDARWQSLGSLRGGRNVWGLLDLPGSGFEVTKGDVVLPYWLVTTSHDGTSGCQVIPTTVRVVCMNTLRAALGSQEFRDAAINIRHSGDTAGKIRAAKLLLEESLKMFSSFEDVARKLADLPADRDSFETLVETLFPTPADDASPAAKTRNGNVRALLAAATQEEVKLLAAPDPTYWTLLNGVTRFVDHARPVQLRGRENAEARFESSLLRGGGVDVKRTAFDTLVKMAGITP